MEINPFTVAFEQIDESSVDRLFAYALSVGDFSLPEYSVTEQLYEVVKIS